MRFLAVIFLAVACSACGSTRGATTYEDVCHTTRALCAIADALCVFAPRATLAESERRRVVLARLDSISTELRKQLHSMEADR